jgi:hypothetical protein
MSQDNMIVAACHASEPEVVLAIVLDVGIAFKA